jgi:hypothetical protein
MIAGFKRGTFSSILFSVAGYPATTRFHGLEALDA